MSFLDDIAGAVLDAFGDDFRDAVLTVQTHTVLDGRGGRDPAADPVDHPCKVLVDDFSDYRRAAGDIPAADRRILILGASLPSGVVPAPGQRLTTEGRAWALISVTRDPASAVYTVQGR